MSEKICQDENLLHPPYEVESNDTESGIVGDSNVIFCHIKGMHFHREMARRIAACLNACQDIPVEALEDGVVKKLTQLCGAVETHNNDLEAQGLIKEINEIWRN